MDAIINHTLDLCDILKERSLTEFMKRNFLVQENKKYLRVITENVAEDGKVIQRSVHCFVDKINGNVYKAASWSSRAKGVRYNLLDDESRGRVMQVADPYGGYLYRC